MEYLKAKVAIEEVAERNGVSVETIRNEIDKAIVDAIENSKGDPIAQMHWKNMSESGTLPTAEELIVYVGKMLGNTDKSIFLS